MVAPPRLPKRSRKSPFSTSATARFDTVLGRCGTAVLASNTLRHCRASPYSPPIAVAADASSSIPLSRHVQPDASFARSRRRLRPPCRRKRYHISSSFHIHAHTVSMAARLCCSWSVRLLNRTYLAGPLDESLGGQLFLLASQDARTSLQSR